MEEKFPNHVHKNFKNINSVIVALKRIRNFRIRLDGHLLDNLRVELRYNRGYSFTLSYKPTPGIQNYKELDIPSGEIMELNNRNRKIFVEPNAFLPNEISYLGIYKQINGTIDSFSSTNNSSNFNNKFHRLVIPLNSKENTNLFDVLPLTAFRYNNTVSVSMTRCIFNETSFDVFIVSEESNNYLVLDSMQLLSFDDFNQCSFSIFLAIGFVTGNFIQNLGYFFTYSSEEMIDFENYRFQNLFESFLTNNPVIPSRIKIESEKEQYLRQRLSSNVFNALCEKIHNIEKIQRSVYNFLFSDLDIATKSVPAYYVMLEALSSYVDSIMPSEKSVPIKDEKLKDELIRKFKELFSQWFDELSHKALVSEGVIEARINTINKPTNTDKLSSSLSSLSINIFSDQKALVKDRDKFLHGSIMKKFSNYSDMNKTMYYYKARLRTLIAALVLKICGYEGYIINYSRLYSPYTNLASSEPSNIKI